MSIAYNSVEGFACGWDDGCRNGARVRGYWKIEPGKTARVSTKGWGNALWWFHATNTGGLVWTGTSPYKVDPNLAFSECSDIAKTTWPTKMFRNIRSTRCCGGSCPSNFTLTLIGASGGSGEKSDEQKSCESKANCSWTSNDQCLCGI